MLIDSDATLEDYCRRWAGAPWLAVDTEFVREQTYAAQLCLIQISDGTHTGVVDALNVSSLAPLLELLYRDDVVKIFHSATQDLELFFQLRDAVPRPLFDSQVAAALLGDGDQLGYAALVNKRLGIELDKSLTRTDWSRRPLRDAEIEYAAADVTHLATLYPQLREALQRADRLGWLEEECAVLTDESRYRPDPQTAWKRLRGLPRLPPSAQSVAAALAAWREQAAIKRNRPRKWMLADDALYRIAEREPDDLAALEALRVLPPKTLARDGEALVHCVRTARTAPPPPTTPELDDDGKRRLKSLRAKVEQCAATLCLPPTLLATRTDLEALVRGEHDDVSLLRGWRRQFAAPILGEVDA